MNLEMLNLEGIQMNVKSFRLCVFVLDELLSCYDCCQFLAPVPKAAHVYHTEIKKPMDFSTLEQQLYKNQYAEFKDFAADLQLIWNNAKSFHRPFDLLYQQAVNLQTKYDNIMKFVQGGSRKPKFFSTSVQKTDEYARKSVPEERITKAPVLYKQVETRSKSVLYFIQAIGENDTNAKKIRGFTNTRFLFQNMNYSFFKYMETNDRDALPLPRFYIAKNRTLLHEAQQNPDGLLAILYNLKTEPTSNPDLIHLNTTVILTEPLGEIHGFDIASMNDTDNKYENCPKAWIKLRAIKIVHNVDTIINTTMEKSFFRRAYNTFRISPKIPADLKKIRNDQVAKQFVRAILDPTSSNNGVTEGTASGPVLSEIVEELGSSQSGGNNDAVGETSLEENISKTPTPSPSPSLGQPSPSIPSAQSTQSPPPSSIPKAVLNNNNNNNNSTTTSSSSPINKVNNTGIKKVIMTVEKKPPTAAPPSSPTPPKIVIPKRSITSISAARAMIEGRSLQQSQQEAVKSPVSSKPSSAASSPTQSPLTTSPKKITLSFQRYLEGEQDDLVSSKEYYLEKSKESWKKLKEFAKEKHVKISNIKDYIYNTSAFPNAEGYFKHVYYLRDDNEKVIQTFRRMTITQRTTEIASLLNLKGLDHVGQITEVLQESHGEVIGLSMKRYQKTLKQYAHAHSHHRLTAHQKMDLICQMLEAIRTIHSVGLAHRDLSEVNFMVDETEKTLEDGSLKANLYLIDFGKSVFINPKDVKRWWTEHPTIENNNTSSEEASISDKATLDGEVVPKTLDELEAWCERLPWIYSKPDHGYRLYRSIQTLPRSRFDNDVLLWLVNPMAEDMYSLGTIIWKIFAETEPWYGILDTDLRSLRETVSDDYLIEQALLREVSGKLSRDLLLQFLKVGPENRKSAADILKWIQEPKIKKKLIQEWQEHSPVGRQKRHAKASNRFEDEQANEAKMNKRRKKQT